MFNLGEERILVTGGAGFIGSHLVEHLSSKGVRVTILDKFSSSSEQNIRGWNIEVKKGTVANTKQLDSLIRECDIVFHLAAHIPETQKYGPGHVVKHSVENPLAYFDSSCRGTLLVLEKCRKHDKELILNSTSAVYGEPTRLPVTEESPTVPSSPYGAAKLCEETFATLYSRLYGLPVAIARSFNVFGPRQRKYVMFDLLLKLMKKPNTLNILGTGQEERDFIFVDDVVDALLLISDSKQAQGRIFNVGTGVGTTISEVVKRILGIVGLSPRITYTGSSWKGNISRMVPDITKIAALGFRPKYSLDEGLKKLVRWFDHEFSCNWEIT
jgi:UDP-glucose 4-epimerase